MSKQTLLWFLQPVAGLLSISRQHLYQPWDYFWLYDVVVCESNPELEFPGKWLQSSLELPWAEVTERCSRAGNVTHASAPPWHLLQPQDSYSWFSHKDKFLLQMFGSELWELPKHCIRPPHRQMGWKCPSVISVRCWLVEDGSRGGLFYLCFLFFLSLRSCFVFYRRIVLSSEIRTVIQQRTNPHGPTLRLAYLSCVMNCNVIHLGWWTPPPVNWTPVFVMEATLTPAILKSVLI